MEFSNPNLKKIIGEIDKEIILLDKLLEEKKREEFENVRRKLIKDFEELGGLIK